MSRLQFRRDGVGYKTIADGIEIPVEIVFSGEPLKISAILDTGAEYCMFGRKIAESFGIAVESGMPLRLRTLTGTLTAYGHEVTLRTFGLEWSAVVYFHDQIGRANPNFLGRTGWLDRVKLGLVHYDQQIFIESYDELTH